MHKKHCDNLKKAYDAREVANKKIEEKNRIEEEKKRKGEKNEEEKADQ